MKGSIKNWCGGFVIFFVVIFLIGCASQKPAIQPSAPPVEKAPSWVLKTPSAKDSLFAVGVATEHGSVPIVRKNAANAARVEMAQVIETKVKALFDGFMKEHADLLDKDAPSTSEEFSRTVTRLATDATLVGSQIVEYYWDKAGKLYYARAMIPKNSLAAEIKAQTEELARQRKTAFAEEKLDDALKMMDGALKDWDVSK